MLSANPLVVGVVYAEEDSGNDARGDMFEVTFEGGAPETRLARLVIDGDHRLDYGNTSGFSAGDVFFDTVESAQSLGVDHAFPFSLVRFTDRNGLPKAGPSVRATVTDGGLRLALDFDATPFEAGDRLVFEIDVDEVQSYNPNETSFETINDGFDPLTSGAEFQGSLFTASFAAPHFENASVESRFLNRYDDAFATAERSLADDGRLALPADDARGNRDRSAGAVGSLVQTALPITIEGTVYHDRNEDLFQDPGAGEEGIAGVSLALLRRNGSGLYVPVVRDGKPVTATADSLGRYAFGLEWALEPGTYRVVETQPAAFSISVGAVPGNVGGLTIGSSPNSDEITDILIADGGTAAVDYDFAEANPARIAGCVYHDRDRDGVRDAGEIGLADVRLDLLDETGQPIASVRTGPDGCYAFTDLRAGLYEIVEFQPATWIDGAETVGQVNGAPRGVVAANDRIAEVAMRSGEQGVGYDFGEFLGSLSGQVHVETNGNCLLDPGEAVLPGVAMTLVDQLGTTRTTTTDAQGRYAFVDLPEGTYSVIESQPAAYFNGGQTAGSGGGDASGVNRITRIVISSASPHLTDYNFCEALGSLSGYVFHDLNNDGQFDSENAESPIAHVLLRLLDGEGRPVPSNGTPITATTDADGHYRFDRLSPGSYQIAEYQPDDWRDGKDSPGFVAFGTPAQRILGASIANDVIGRIDLIQSGSDRGTMRGVQYNFGELRGISIAGHVYTDLNGNCVFEPEATFPQPQQREAPLSGVVVRLVDASGRLVSETRTDASGAYAFRDLTPGRYTLEQTQPADYFDVGHVAGNLGGDTGVPNRIADITLVSGDEGVGYDFCEAPPAELTGYVFQDGPAILVTTGEGSAPIHTIRDGIRTSDDTPIAGVWLELRNGLDGSPVTSDDVLPGYHASGVLRVQTDADGHYRFAGLPRGNYAVYQTQPSGYADASDTPGTTLGVAWNAHEIPPMAVLARMADHPPPRYDAILNVPLGYGQRSEENNFSEVRTTSYPKIEEPPGYPKNPIPPATIKAVPPPRVPFLPPPPPRADIPIYGAAGDTDVTWHLSIIDAGRPRGDGDIAAACREYEYFVRSSMIGIDWTLDLLRSGEWTIFVNAGHDDGPNARREWKKLFGINGAIPVAGDFDGDGKAEVGVFLKGEWFIDVNGNGEWDRNDLWARLGADTDLPVVGDWNGDGKDDIGIFGPIWERDPVAIEHEPGLPDSRNPPKAIPKNVPPDPDAATNGVRLLRLTAEGEPRADLIDHVFKFGSAGDQPVVGDWDGDGIANIGVFRRGTWILDTNGDGRLDASDRTFAFGQPGDRPLAGRFTGEGIDVVGIWRDGRVVVDSNHNEELDAADRVFELSGQDSPIVGDFDGDGIDEVALYRNVGPTGVQARRVDPAVQ